MTPPLFLKHFGDAKMTHPFYSGYPTFLFVWSLRRKKSTIYLDIQV